MKAIRLRITGHVQGVFFRSETQRVAIGLGLTGWVRNCEDGSVEVFAEGPEKALRKLEQWCWEGPPRSEVTDVYKEDATECGTLERFEIHY